MDIIEKIVSIFLKHGGNAYIGESVTQLEHALQTATAARRHKATPVLVSAALLHDIGHFLHDYVEQCADYNIDSQHEVLGEKFLRRYFVAEVAELVGQHVNAKRYLCATNEEYYQNLSAASVHSLQLQGGPMLKNEIIDFEAHPLFKDILMLRYWDEGAKIPGKILPPILDFIPELKLSCIRTSERG